MGSAFTLAVSVSNVPDGHRRLFSVYDGGGPVRKGSGEMIFDICPGGSSKVGACLRFGFDDECIALKPKDIPGWLELVGSDRPTHFAATWDDGLAIVYVNGKEVGRAGRAGHGPAVFTHGDVRFGEDYPPTSTTNEPFCGLADDILVLRRALTGAEVARLAAEGAKAVIGPSEAGVLYTMDGPDAAVLVDRLDADGRSDAPLAEQDAAWGEAMLLLNMSTSAAGSVRCELQTDKGTPIPGFMLDECGEIFGDSIERIVSWRGGRTELKELAGKPVRLHLELKDADVYAFRFGQPLCDAKPRPAGKDQR